MDNTKAGYSIQSSGSSAIRTPAVDQLNQRLASVQSSLIEFVSRTNMVANKLTGATPPFDKPGQPAAIPSCSIDWLNEIERSLGDLSTAINRLD